MRQSPSITIIICTRNRGAAVGKTITAALANHYANFEIVVIDQSDDEATENAVADYLHEVRLRYVRSTGKGLAAARNLGCQLAYGEIIAMTDDDCEAQQDWLQNLAAAFAQDDRIGMVLGNVIAAPHTKELGFIPAYVRREAFLARSIKDKHKVEGIGACFAFRRQLWLKLHGFDEMLGAGAQFKAAEETDFMIRLLFVGYYIFETPQISVIHHGFRTWKEGGALIHGYLYGIGAMLTKHLKLGNWSILHVFYHLAHRWAFAKPVVDFGHRPSKWLRLQAFSRGCLDAVRSPVDKERKQFFLKSSQDNN